MIHLGQPVHHTGTSLEQAKAAMVMIHGRGASAESILTLSQEFRHNDFAYLAPQATGYSWYPNSFLAPLESNEPGITSGMRAISDIIQHINTAGHPTEKIMLLGFSQGACLVLEYAARHAGRYGGIVALSGGLIGPAGTPRNYAGSLEGTPIFIGCSDVDFHIPLERVHESTQVLQSLGGNVTERIYPGMGHTVNQDEISFVRGMMQALVAS
jgi:predicted esterase